MRAEAEGRVRLKPAAMRANARLVNAVPMGLLPAISHYFFCILCRGSRLIVWVSTKMKSELYQQRLSRYVTAMRNEKPDRVPIRPFVAEFTAKYAGLHLSRSDPRLSQKPSTPPANCARDFDWDAVVPNMVYVWTGLAQAIGLRYYGIPGIGIPHDIGFNYIEPPGRPGLHARRRIRRADRRSYRFPLQRLAAARFDRGRASPASPRPTGTTCPWSKAGMAMLAYFNAFGPQIARLRDGVRHRLGHCRDLQGAL